MDGSNVIGNEKNVAINSRDRIEKLGINFTSFMLTYKTVEKAKNDGQTITDQYVNRIADMFNLSIDRYEIAKNIFKDTSCGNEAVIPLPSSKVEVKLPTFMTRTEGKSKIHEVTARTILAKYAVDVLQKIDDENVSHTITKEMIGDLELSRDDQSKVITAIDLADKMKKEVSLPVTNDEFESMSDDVSFRILMDEFEQKIRSEICREDYPEEMTGVNLDFSKNSIDAVNDLLAVAQERNGKLKPSDIVDDLGFVKDSPVVSKFLSGVYLLNLVDDEVARLEKLDHLTKTFVKQVNPIIGDPAMRIGQPANDDKAPSARHSFMRAVKNVAAAAAAVLVFGASGLFNGAAQKTDINTASLTGAFDIIETVQPASDDTYREPSILELNFSFLSPEEPFDDMNITKPVIDVPVPRSRLSALSPMMASFERNASIPEYTTQSFQPKLNVANAEQYIRNIYTQNGAQISTDMQEFFDKISGGLESDNMNVATVGAYDAARLMSKELGANVAGLKSRKIYAMIEKLGVSHPVTRWARNGAAMKLPSQTLS